MSRDIKYQCVDTKDKIIWNPLTLQEIIEWDWEMGGFYYDGEYKWDYASLPHKDYNFHVHPDNVVWRQYTWLKDKNWVEIYEGDVLQIYTRDNERSFKDEVKDLYDFFQRGYISWYDAIKHSHIEIIWNIYENPELLTNQ